MKRQKISSITTDDVKAWKQAAQWLIDNASSDNASVKVLALGVEDDDWGDHCLEVRDKLVVTIDGHPHRLFEDVDGIWIQPVLPDQLYIVQMADYPYTVLEGLPTPMLIESGEALAWMQDKNIWRKKEHGDPMSAKYTKVRVFRNPNQ